jgi:hypothetical protein
MPVRSRYGQPELGLEDPLAQLERPKEVSLAREG